jgi:hypothetical protein
MTGQRVEVSLYGLARLRSAISDFARVEIAKIAQEVIDNLHSRPSNGTFDEVNARHLWDEYCWALQEGPFDDNMSFGDLPLTSLSDAFDELVRSCIIDAVEKLPGYANVLLSGLAFENDEDSDEDESFGGICIDGIVNLVLEQVNDRASQRPLGLIGPHRGDEIGYEISGSGMVWSELSETGEARDLIGSHVDAMIDPDGDLSELADAMVDAFMTAAGENADGAVCGLLSRFDHQIRSLLHEDDVLPSLKAMRGALLKRLDP